MVADIDGVSHADDSRLGIVAITLAIVTSAMAERVKLSAFLVFEIF